MRFVIWGINIDNKSKRQYCYTQCAFALGCSAFVFGNIAVIFRDFMDKSANIINILCVIKSPRYTGGDFMFLYRFVRHRRRRRRRRPQILVHAITFEQLFGFL